MRRGWLASIGILWLAACAEPTAPVVQPTLDDALFHVQLADALSAVGAKDLGLPVVRATIRRGPECPFDASTRRFECDETRAYVLFDAAGVAQDGWNDRVEAIRFLSSYKDDSTSWRDEATLSGLRSPQQRLTGSATLTWTRGAEAWTGTRTTDLILLSRVIMPGIFPSGTIDLSVRRAESAQPAFVAMTYDGTSIVTMLSSFAGGARLSCTYDLLKPDASKSCAGS